MAVLRIRCRSFYVSALFGAVALTAFSAGAETAGEQTSSATEKAEIMKVRIAIQGNSEMTATLEDSAAASDFIALLPVTITLSDYASTEKISDLPQRLSTHGAPEGITPVAGDLAYYSPWGNLAIFHKNFGYSKGLIKLGTLDSGLEAIRRPGPLVVTIEVVPVRPLEGHRQVEKN